MNQPTRFGFVRSVTRRFPSITKATSSFVLVFCGSVQVMAQTDAEPELPPAELEDLVVTASLTPVALQEVVSSVTVITREQIEQRQVRFLSDLLRDVPGFAVSQAGGPGTLTQVRVRGAEANQMLVLIDGIRANDPAASDEFQWQYALTPDIERVEIIRGPQSAIWGSEAVSGVINIIRRKGSRQNSVNFRGEAGSFGTADLSADGGWDMGGVQLRAGFSHYDTDGINISRTGNEKDGADNTTLDIGLEWDISEELRLSASGQMVDASNDFDATDFLTSLPADADRVTEAEQAYWRSALDFRSSDGQWSANASVNYSDTDNQNFADGGFNSSTAAQTLEFRARATRFWQGSREHQQRSVTLAADRRDVDFDQAGIASAFGDPNQSQSYDNTGVAAEYMSQLFEGFNWTVSGRYDDFSDFDSIATWRIGASHQVTEQVTVRGSYGTGAKAPTFTERFGFFEDFFLGNPDLKPETSRGWEFALDTYWLNDRLTLTGIVFDNVLIDEIDGFVFDPGTGFFTAANRDNDSDRSGVEVLLGAQFSDALSVSAAYTYTNSVENLPNGASQREVRRPRHLASLGVNYRFAQNRGNLNLNINYTGEQLDLFFDPVTFTPEIVVLDSFLVTDLAASWQLTEHLELVARVQNLTDEDYEEILGFVRPGRAWYGGLRGRFGF